MKTRLVRVRRKSWTMWWAVLLLAAAMALYIRVSLPRFEWKAEESEETVSVGERMTKEVTIEPLAVHLISFGEYDSTPDAQIEAARYVSRGAAGYVLDGEKRQVIASGYDDLDEARQVCELLMESEEIDARVISLSADGFSIRMTAGSRQIEAFSQAQQILRGSADVLMQLAFSIDRGEASAYQAVNVIRTHCRQFGEAHNLLKAQYEGQSSEMFTTLLCMMEDMLSQMDKMQKEIGVMALSSRLKYFYIDARVRQIEWMNDISVS